MSTHIHPTAIVSPKAQLAENVVVGPYCIIGDNVKVGANSSLRSHVILDGHLEIGENNQFYSFCSIGTEPQDLTYKGEPTKVVIGNNNVFREYVSIHRGTLKEEGLTRVGNDSLFMAYVHVGHDVVIGNKCVIVNSVNFAGHVKIGDRVIIGGGTNVSQFIHIGRGAYIGGASGIDRDIPPFCTAYGNRARLKGINIVGMRRHGFEKPVISEVVDFFRLMESSALAPRNFVEKVDDMSDFINNEIVQEISKSIIMSEVGIAPFMS